MKKLKVKKLILNYGKKIKNGWLKNAKKNSIQIVISGQDSIPYLSFDYKNNLEILTYFTQEMLKKGFLAGGQVATSFAYNNKIINKYLNAVDEVFGKIRFCLNNNKFPLKGEIKHSTFKRLTG